MKIPLGRYGDKGYTLVDADKASEVIGYCWSLGSDGYAKRMTSSRGAIKRTTVFLHRQLLGVLGDTSVQVDHINGDKLDNQLENLRTVPLGANAQNRNFDNKGTSRFRGVGWHHRDKVWVAGVKLNGKNRHLGNFQSEIAAAQVAEAFRLEHMPFAEPEPELLRFYEEQHAC